MNDVSEIFKNFPELIDDTSIFETLKISENAVSKLLKSGIDNRISLDAFYAAYNYWVSMTTKRLPANLIQAQRDFFGAHTYQKIDENPSQYFHTNWQKS